MTGKLKLDFGKLPLVEAAVRVSFVGPKGLSFSIVNSIHAELKDLFPALTESQQIEIVPGLGGMQLELGPGYLPGAVYAGHVSGVSVHVHPQVIVVRWSKRPGLAERSYPRYPTLRESLWRTVEAFRKACGDEFPGIAIVNMSYVNFVPTLNPTGALRQYFSEAANLQAMKDAQQIRKLEAAWSEREGLDVRFAIEQASARFPDQSVTEGLRLTTAAGLRLGESIDAKTGLELVHDELQNFFLRLISDHAKQDWQLDKAHSHE